MMNVSAKELATESVKTVERWYTVAQVCELTGFHKSFIYAQLTSGKLRSKKVGKDGRRVPESALAEWQASFDGSGEIAGRELAEAV
jgi:excisionase family DNA binding protein